MTESVHIVSHTSLQSTVDARSIIRQDILPLEEFADA